MTPEDPCVVAKWEFEVEEPMKNVLCGILLVLGVPAFGQQTAQMQPTIQYILLGLLLLILVLIAVDILRRSRRPEDSSQYKLLSGQHDTVAKEANQLRGRAEQLQLQAAKSDSQLSTKSTEVAELTKKLAAYESTEAQRKRDAEKSITDLENARKALEEERKRVLEDERQVREAAENVRTRIWSLHEESSRSAMKEICQKADIALTSFDNTSLPEGFDPKLKPDFMIRLLGQYVIFDTKSSQSQSLQTYIKSQVQATAKKIKASESYNDIYKTVFFVIPDIGLKDIKETFFVEQGISFSVIPIQAFEPIVRTLRRLEDYELAEKYDPQERENIINVLATYDQYVRQQNAVNILSTIRGIKVMSEKESIPAEVQSAVDARRAKLRLEQMSTSSLKKLMDDPELQAKELLELIAPKKPEVDSKDLKDAEPLF
jgi:hypothetical protein